MSQRGLNKITLPPTHFYFELFTFYSVPKPDMCHNAGKREKKERSGEGAAGKKTLSVSVSRLSGDIRKIVPVIGRYCLFMADGVR